VLYLLLTVEVLTVGGHSPQIHITLSISEADDDISLHLVGTASTIHSYNDLGPTCALNIRWVMGFGGSSE